MFHDALSGGELMKRINDTLEKNANNELQAHGITFTQIQMLLALSTMENGSATLKELEKYFGVAQSTAAGVAVRLEKKKLVTGFTDSEDKRIKHIKITDAGKELCRAAQKSMNDSEQRLLGGLTPEERTQFISLLKKIYDAMESRTLTK